MLHLKDSNMASYSKNPEISDVSLRPVINGFELSYSKKEKRNESDEYSDCYHKYCTEVFKTNEKTKAIARMMELSGMEDDSEEMEEPNKTEE